MGLILLLWLSYAIKSGVELIFWALVKEGGRTCLPGIVYFGHSRKIIGIEFDDFFTP